MTEHHFSTDHLMQFIREEERLRKKVREGTLLTAEEDAVLHYIQALLNLLLTDEEIDEETD